MTVPLTFNLNTKNYEKLELFSLIRSVASISRWKILRNLVTYIETILMNN